MLAGNAWADIDAQLKRRHDLIPNLVETVRGDASHEQESFQTPQTNPSQIEEALQSTRGYDKAVVHSPPSTVIALRQTDQTPPQHGCFAVEHWDVIS